MLFASFSFNIEVEVHKNAPQLPLLSAARFVVEILRASRIKLTVIELLLYDFQINKKLLFSISSN